MSNQTCGNCALFKPYYRNDESQWEDGEPGQCNWDPGALPLSWQYAPREVMGVSADTNAEGCVQWASRDNLLGDRS